MKRALRYACGVCALSCSTVRSTGGWGDWAARDVRARASELGLVSEQGMLPHTNAVPVVPRRCRVFDHVPRPHARLARAAAARTRRLRRTWLQLTSTARCFILRGIPRTTASQSPVSTTSTSTTRDSRWGLCARRGRDATARRTLVVRRRLVCSCFRNAECGDGGGGDNGHGLRWSTLRCCPLGARCFVSPAALWCATRWSILWHMRTGAVC